MPARNDTGGVFKLAKKFALLGSGLGIVVWLGLFGVIGGAVFQMWQTGAGSASLAGAFQYATSCAMVFIIINMSDE